VTPGPAAGRAREGLRVLDEALKLLDAVQAPPFQSAGAGEQPAAEGPHRQAHRGGECRVCPVCRGLAALREANPEAVARMGRALADLAAAFAEFAGAPGDPDATPPARPAPPRPVRVQRIDVTD
jgi:Ser/Thr protein kinase RdoA (MazF antagonist)